METYLKVKKSYLIQTVLEITIVLTIMLVINSIADYFEINSAGSIAIWSGIFVTTVFLNRRKSNWQDLGLIFTKEQT